MILTSARVNGVLNRFYVLPPGTPKDRVLLLRNAFMETMKDPEFIADAQKAKLDLDPIDGDDNFISYKPIRTHRSSSILFNKFILLVF